MTKSASKSSAHIEVVEDSEEEQRQSSKQKDASNPGNMNGEEENEEGDDEEYEIEAILDAKHGAFPGGRTGYLVRWKGYSSEHNSWVDEQDAEGAAQMIEEYWERHRKLQKSKSKQPKGRPRKSEGRTSPDVDEPSSQRKRRRSGGVSKSSRSSHPEQDGPKEDENEEDEQNEQKPKSKKSKKSSRDEENQMDVDETEDQGGEYLPMDTTKYREKSWEKLVQRVDTIEKSDGVLKVFFTLNNGDKVVEPSRECAKHFPQKMIQFYESNLRWRETEQ